jgi:ligand-binding sensor domain-containing protein/signal transduction histidine kinase
MIIGQNRLYCDHLTAYDGLSQTHVYAVIQDKKGFMWFGTQDGLNRYDGNKFTVFRHESHKAKSLASSYHHALCEDSEGNIWAGGIGLSRFNPDTYEVENVNSASDDLNSFANNSIMTMIFDKSGQLWVGSSKGLACYQPQKKTLEWFYTDSINTTTIHSNTIQNLYIDTEGVLWIGTNLGLSRYDLGTRKFKRYTLLPQKSRSISEDIAHIYQDKSGTIWVSTNNLGLFRLQSDKQTFVQYQNQPNDSNSLSHNDVNQMYEDRNGQFWVSTENGMNILDRKTGKFKRFYHNPADKYSLGTNGQKVIFEDREGVLWFAGRKNIDRYNSRRRLVELYYPMPNDSNSLSNANIWQMVEDEQGSVWVATIGDGLNQVNRKTGQVKHYRYNPNDPNSLANNYVFAVLLDKKGQIWTQTKGGVSCLNRQTGLFKRYSFDPKNPYSFSSSQASGASMMCQDFTGRIWLGTDNGLNWFDEKTERFYKYVHDPNDPLSISYNRICSIFEDSRHDIWVGTWGGGVNRWNRKSNTFTRFLPNPNDTQSIINNRIYVISEDKNGLIWLGGHLGMSSYNPQTNHFRNYTSQDGLPNNVVYGIIPDDKNRLWISTNWGLACFNQTDNTFRHFGPSDGLQHWEYGGFSHFKNPRTGELYFGGIGGFNIFHPDSLAANRYQPPVVITTLKRFNTKNAKIEELETTNLAHQKNIKLPYDAGLLTFEFAALSFSNPQKNQYSYQLLGFSEQWIPLGNQHELTLAALPHGHYTLRVKGSNGDGFWNEKPTELSITVLPPWYQTWWFRLFIGTICAATIWWLFHLRTQRLLALQQMEFDKQNALEKERTRIARDMHDDIGSGLSAINLLANYIKNTPLSTDTHLEIKHIAESSTELNQRIREIIWSVSSDSDNMEGLAHFLRRYVSEFGEMQHIDTQFIAPDNLPEMKLSNEAKRNLFLCVKEALNNTTKYAKATLIEVSIRVEEHNLLLTIKDNGVGFDLETALKNGGNGLKNIQARMKQVGGNAFISVEKGCLIQCQLPLK